MLFNQPVLAFLGGAIGPAELMVVLLAVLLLFGPRRLPEMARTIGKTFEQLRRSADEVRDQILKADQDTTLINKPVTPPPPAPGPTEPDSANSIPQEKGAKKPDDWAG